MKKKKFITILVCFIVNIYKINNIKQELSIYNNVIESISKKINKVIKDLSNNKNLEKCLNIMKHSFQGKYKNSYLTKLFYDSSPNFEDIKNYYNCYSNLYNEEDKDILENITFIIIKYKDKKYNNHTEYENSFNSFCKVFGACIPQGCKDQEYYEILNHINNDNNYHLIDGNIDGVVNLKSVKNYSFIKKISQLLIPLLMIIFIILVFEIKHISGLLWSLFGYFFNKFHKNHFGEENIKKILKINKLNQIDTLNGFIKLNNNIEEVMPGSKESQISNEDGLQIVVGLRGIFIIGLFLGLTLQNIFTTPTRIFDDKQYKQYMNTYLYCILFFCARISQKMLYSLSGFELTFKLLFYFDNQLYKKYISSVQNIDLNNMNLNKYVEDSSSNSVIYSQSNSKKNISEKNQINLVSLNKNISQSLQKTENKKAESRKLKSLKSQSINEDDNEENEEIEGDEESEENNEEEKLTINLISHKRKKSNDNIKTKTNSTKSKDIKPKKFIGSIDKGKIYLNNHEKLPFQSLLTFHLRQSYLYFIFICSIIYFIFWQTQYFIQQYEKGSLWIMITSEIKEYFDSKIFFSTIFLLSGTCASLNNYYNFFIPAMNEIFFYLFGSSLIYYCYKKNSRLDKSLLIIIFLVIFIKFIIFLAFKDNNNYLYHPSLDFMQYKSYFFIQIHFLNLSYYCIGMMVGLANYSLQNDVKKKKIVKEFVKLPRKLYYIIKRKYNFIFGLSLFIIFLFSDIFLYKIYLFLNNKKKYVNNIDVEYFKSSFINIFSLLDCEIIIACIYILSIIVFYSSYSFLRDNFNASPWKILSRIYFSLLITSYKHSNWFLFQFAERIDLNIIWVSYILTLIFILSVVRSIAIYVFFQVPLKKLTKFIYFENNKIIDELNYLCNNDRSGSISVCDTNSIDLNADNTRFYINGRKESGDFNEENDIIRTDFDLVIESNEENSLNNN